MKTIEKILDENDKLAKLTKRVASANRDRFLAEERFNDAEKDLEAAQAPERAAAVVLAETHATESEALAAILEEETRVLTEALARHRAEVVALAERHQAQLTALEESNFKAVNKARSERGTAAKLLEKATKEHGFAMAKLKAFIEGKEVSLPEEQASDAGDSPIHPGFGVEPSCGGIG